jgi:hypothetical protein
MSNVTVSMKMSPKATGALYMKSIKQVERIVELEKAIHYATDYLDDNKLNSIVSGSKAHMELQKALKVSK